MHAVLAYRAGGVRFGFSRKILAQPAFATCGDEAFVIPSDNPVVQVYRQFRW